MEAESNVLRLLAQGTVTCHLTVPRFGDVIADEDDVPGGLVSLAAQMGFIAEQFNSLARIFFDCPEATYSSETFFVHGHLTFVFQVPRRLVPRLRQLGWSTDDLDVESGAGGTVPGEPEIPDA